MSHIIKNNLSPEDRFIALYDQKKDFLFNGESTYLTSLRTKATERFLTIGFPKRKDEAWKYTNLNNLLKRDYRPSPVPSAHHLTHSEIAPHFIDGMDAFEVVLINGQYSEELSSIDGLPEGTIITSLTDAGKQHTGLVQSHFARYADYHDDALVALNTAFSGEGLFIYVPEDVVVSKPIYVLSLHNGDEDTFIQPRNLFVFERQSQVTLVDKNSALLETSSFTNVVDEIFVGANAHVVCCKIQDEGNRASLITNTHVYQEGDSNFSIFTVTLTGELVRNNLYILPDAENCETHLYGLFVPRGQQHVDNHTLVDHAKPLCTSNQLYKGILGGKATGVFNGKVFVRQDAQKISAFQEHKTIILSDQAKMNAKPELEIYADDVKCSHGSTTGQIDKEAMFYLRSRGIPEAKARVLLLQAFTRDVLDQISIEPLKKMIEMRLAGTFKNGSF